MSPLPLNLPTRHVVVHAGLLTAAFGLGGASNTCAKCGITFRMTSDLVYHMRTHHGRQEKDRYNYSMNNSLKKSQATKLRCRRSLGHTRHEDPTLPYIGVWVALKDAC